MIRFTYKKLFKKMIDLEINNSQLMEMAGISTDVLVKICNVLNCDISEIVECVEE